MKRIKILPAFIVIAMLAFSVRLAEVAGGMMALTGAAYAEESAHEGAAEEHHEAPAASEEHGSAEGGHDAAASAPATEEEEFPEWRDPAEDDPSYEAARMAVFKDLSRRREELDDKERTLESKEALLRAAEKELDRKYQELSALRTELEGLLKVQSEEEQKRITSLVKIYEGMKPKDAARIFDTLDLDILLDVVAQMSERKLSPILASMNPDRAQTLTIMLAEQKQLPTLPY